MTEETDPAVFAHSLTDKALHCRELGHVWRPLSAVWDSAAKVYDRQLRCSSCRATRSQTMTESGHIVSNRYVYADGYLAKGVHVGRSNRDAYRVEALQRFLSPTSIRGVA